MKNLFFFLLILALCPMSWSIGRTGNKRPQGLIEVADPNEGFVAAAPEVYPLTEPMGNDNLRMRSVVTDGSTFSGTPTIELLRLSTIFPQLKGMSRTDIANQLAKDGWLRSSLNSSDPCLDVFVSGGNGVAAGLALWSDSKGLLIRGLDGVLNRDAVDTILSTLRIDPTMCEWKTN